MMLIKNNGPGDSTPDAETRITSPPNCNGFILCLCELFLSGHRISCSRFSSLYRGKKVVIIGDEKQLRPSDLFELKEDEYEVDEDIDRTLLSESLLTLANRAFNCTYLRWHYRSAFQELIDFSNHAFYEGRLKIAPNILRGVTPIRWIACDYGVWLDRKNVPEAIRVVDELKGIFLPLSLYIQVLVVVVIVVFVL